MVKLLMYFIIINAQGGAGDVGYIFDYGMSARAFGMGSAFYGIMGDGASGFYNPASLSFLLQDNVTLGYVPLPMESKYAYIAFSKIMQKRGNFSVYFMNLSTKGFEGRDSRNNLTHNYDFVQYAGGAVYARKVTDKIGIGAKVKMLYSRISLDIIGGVGLDAGIYAPISSYVNTGLVVKNIVPITYTPQQERETAPLGFVSGTVFKPTNNIVFDLDLLMSPYSGFSARFGGEARLLDVFSLRGGINNREITGGIGVERSYRDYTLCLDYSYAMGLGNFLFKDLHRFSLSFKFGGFRIYAISRPSRLVVSGGESVAKIELHANVPQDIQDWEFIVKTGSGEVVRKFFGKGTPPLTITWDGRDQTGKIVPDGTYYYRLHIVDILGNQYQQQGKLVKVVLAL